MTKTFPRVKFKVNSGNSPLANKRKGAKNITF